MHGCLTGELVDTREAIPNDTGQNHGDESATVNNN